jgi:spore maturation protein CgeB
VTYYAETRDGWPTPPGCRLCLYDALDDVHHEAVGELRSADVAIVTSYCPDGPAAAELLLAFAAGIKAFYDLDTPITLQSLFDGQKVSYLPKEGLGGFDLVLSYTGGRALNELRSRLNSQRVAPLYGWVDPDIHRPTLPVSEFRSELSYLGTFAADRQDALEEFFVHVALAKPEARFVIGGAQYPDSFPWTGNIYFVRHLPPALHPAFFGSGRATLNVTRRAMAAYGFCPSGRLFEAAACGTPILSDCWEGLEAFFDPVNEILPVTSTADVLAALSLSDKELRCIGEAARSRVLQHHTAGVRVLELERLLEGVNSSALQPA